MINEILPADEVRNQITIKSFVCSLRPAQTLDCCCCLSKALASRPERDCVRDKRSVVTTRDNWAIDKNVNNRGVE